MKLHTGPEPEIHLNPQWQGSRNTQIAILPDKVSLASPEA